MCCVGMKDADSQEGVDAPALAWMRSMLQRLLQGLSSFHDHETKIVTIGDEGSKPIPEWRSDLDALAFRPASSSGLCVVHRRAFRALVGHPASDQECLSYFRAEWPAFVAAALAKIARQKLTDTDNFHLTSRDVNRSKLSCSA